MNIQISLNKQSIKNAIKQLNAVKKIIPDMNRAFLEEVAHWVTNRANEYLDRADLGSLVKEQIKGGWKYEPTANGVKVINRTEKAVFVEFGVGIVGQSQAHPNASEEGYEYNVQSPAKFLGGYWSFNGNLESLDLPKDSVEYEQGQEGIVFLTQGAKGVWYAYNAIVDAQMELSKANGGKIGELWEKVKKRYIK